MSESKKTLLRRVTAKASKEPMVLGYTRTGRPVLLPRRSAPDTSDVVIHQRTKTNFSGWTKGDHVDASKILMEHSEREPNQKAATWCARWATAHWDLGGRRSN